MVRAVVGLLPLDDFVEAAAFRMEVVGAPGEVPPVIREFEAILKKVGYARPIASVERFDFYRQAADAYAIVATGERRFWGNLILKKGALPPP